MSTSNFDQQIINQAGGMNANTGRAATPLVKSKTPDEKNPVKVKRTITYLVNGESYAIVVDGVVNQESLDIISKLTGAVVRMDEQGNISVQTGTPGQNGKYCGGKFQVNARGGTLQKYGGGSAFEFTGQNTSATETTGESNSSKDGEADEVQALSVLCYGDNTEETHGHRYIRGRNITIDAGDVLTLLAKEKIIIQAGPTGGGEISMRCGKRTIETDINDEWIKSQNMRITREETNMNFDPRGTQNLITTGHLNHRVLGDYVLQSAGVGRMNFAGGTFAAPLVTDMRTSAFDISCVLGNLSMITHVGSILSSTGVKAWPDMGGIVGGISSQAVTTIKQAALLNVDIDAGVVASLDGVGAVTVASKALLTLQGLMVDIKAATGPININTPGIIMLN